MELQFTDYVRYKCPNCGNVEKQTWGVVSINGIGSYYKCNCRYPEDTEIVPCDPNLAREYKEAKAAQAKANKEAAEAATALMNNAGPITCGCITVLAIVGGLIYFFLF